MVNSIPHALGRVSVGNSFARAEPKSGQIRLAVWYYIRLWSPASIEVLSAVVTVEKFSHSIAFSLFGRISAGDPEVYDDWRAFFALVEQVAEFASISNRKHAKPY
jgi:hypothetical protein